MSGPPGAAPPVRSLSFVLPHARTTQLTQMQHDLGTSGGVITQKQQNNIAHILPQNWCRPKRRPWASPKKKGRSVLCAHRPQRCKNLHAKHFTGIRGAPFKSSPLLVLELEASHIFANGHALLPYLHTTNPNGHAQQRHRHRHKRHGTRHHSKLQ